MGRERGDRDQGTRMSQQVADQQTPLALVGRTSELAALTAALDRAGQGAGSMVCLTGAMGTGKSRLAAEAVAIARDRGYLVLTSFAYPLDDRLIYAPVISALGRYLRQLPGAEQEELLAGLPYLSRLTDSPAMAQSEPVPAMESINLLESVVRLLERTSKRAPVLWFIDDLHWADPASVELFCYLARNLRGISVLLLATYRSGNTEELGHLYPPLLTLARHRLSEEVRLARLSPKEIAQLVGVRLGARPARPLLEYLEARAQGTPLIALALLDSLEQQGLLTRGGGAVSLNPEANHRPSLAAREIILERLAPLTEQERQVLDRVAVIGGSAQLGELLQVIGWERPALLAVLGRLQEAGLLSAQVSTADASVVVSLAHPFFQEVLYDELPSLVRREYHAQVATALEGMPNVPVERLARQYEGAGGEPNPARALEVLLAAGARADLAAAPEAPHYYWGALALVRGGLQPELLPTILLRLGQSLTRTSQLDAARDALQEALAVLSGKGDGHEIGCMHVHLSFVEFMEGNLATAGDHARVGIERLRGSGWGYELLYAYGMNCVLHLLQGDTGGVFEAAGILREAVVTLDTPASRAWQLFAQVWVELLSSQVAASVEAARACLEQAWLSQDPLLIVLGAQVRAITLLLRGDHRLTASELRGTLARMPGTYLQSAEHGLGPMLTVAEVMAGRWEAALAVSDESAPLEELLQVLPRANLGARAVVLIRQGDLAQARACLDETGRYQRPLVTDFEYAEALYSLESGDYPRASEEAARLYAWPLSPLAFAVQAEAQAAMGDADAVRNIANLLIMIGSQDLPLVTALGEWASGLADRVAGDAAAAVAAFARAAAAFDRLEMPFEAARARFEQAALLAARDRRAASNLAQRSLQAFARLGAKLWIERVRRWRAGQSRRSEAGERKPGTLFSQRELEIVRLLDEGLTTAEMAARLLLSPRTVSTHLDRMYNRHGLKNRLGLVRFAREAGAL